MELLNELSVRISTFFTTAFVIRLRLLGGVSLERDGQAISGKATQRRRLALLAILAVSRASMGRERLLVLLWPEQGTSGGRRLLSESLHVLRKELGAEAFLSAGDEVGLNPDALTCDLWQFEDAVRAGRNEMATAAYSGPLLDGFFVSGAEDFEKWLDTERDRTQRTYSATLERAAQECERGNQFELAAEWWVKLLRIDPASTRYAHRLMCALEAVGDVASAIRHASAHANVLREEIGVEPPPEFLRELDRLRRAPNTARLGANREPEARDLVEQRSIASGSSVATHHTDVSTPPPSKQKRNFARLAVFAAVGSSVILTVVLVLNAALAGRSAPPLDPRRIAILYFDDLSADNSLEHIAAGVTETLIHELSLVKGLHIVPRNGVRLYRDRSVSPVEIATTLQAGTLVTGSMQLSAGRLRVMVELSDGQRLHQAQSKILERPVGELFALEDDIAIEVAGFLRRRLGEEIRVREGVAGTRSAQARDLFLRAEQVRAMVTSAATEVHPLDARGAMALLATADSLFLRASSHDRKWALPLISRGWIVLQRAGMHPPSIAKELFGDAVRLADSALVLGSERAASLELRGTARWRLVFLGHDIAKHDMDALLAAAATDLQDAVAAEPSMARSWSTLSQLLRLRGDLAAADVAAERALQEDEFIDESAMITERLYRSSFALGRYDKARVWCERGLRQFPNDWRFVECGLTLLGYDTGVAPDVATAWRVFEELGQLDPADHAVNSGRSYSPVYRKMAVARVVARAGLADSARAMLTRARADVGTDAAMRSSLLYDEAYIRLLLGEHSAAIALLEEYVRLKPLLRTYVARDIQFRRLRGDPRFDSISRAP